MRAREFAGPAYRFLRTEAGALANLALPVVCVILVGNLLPGLAGGGVDLVLFVANLVSVLALVQFARVVLAGLAAGQPPTVADLRRVDGVTWSLGWRWVVGGVVAWLPAVGAVALAFVIALSRAFGSRGGSDEEYLILVIVPPGVLLSLWLTTRWALVPVLAVAPTLNVTPGVGPFGSSWALTRGHAWLIFKVLVMTAAPFILLSALMPLSGMRYNALGIVSVAVQGIIGAVLHLGLIAVAGHALVALSRRLRAAAPTPSLAAP